MSDYEDLHGQILCFGGVAPLAGRGADNTQRIQQDTRGDVAATQLSQLSWLWYQDILGQNLMVHITQSVTIRLRKKVIGQAERLTDCMQCFL